MGNTGQLRCQAPSSQLQSNRLANKHCLNITVCGSDAPQPGNVSGGGLLRAPGLAQAPEPRVLAFSPGPGPALGWPRNPERPQVCAHCQIRGLSLLWEGCHLCGQTEPEMTVTRGATYLQLFIRNPEWGSPTRKESLVVPGLHCETTRFCFLPSATSLVQNLTAYSNGSECWVGTVATI